MIRLTRAQVRLVDRLAVERYHIPGIVLMENAARAVADAAAEMIASPKRARVLILCGPGNNGGDGLAVARHLHNRGMRVRIALFFDPESFQGDARINWDVVKAMKLPVEPATPEQIDEADPQLVIDAIWGTGLNQPAREPFPELVQALDRHPRATLAVDVPSGLDVDTGRPYGACIRATRTVTFVAEKVGFAEPEAKPYLGEVVVGDIGCPKELIEEVLKE